MIKAWSGGHAFGKSHCCDDEYIDVGIPTRKHYKMIIGLP